MTWKIRRETPATASIQRELTEKVKPHRVVYLRWPYGHPLGESFYAAQQRWVLLEALRALEEITVAGTIRDLGYRWKKPGPWGSDARTTSLPVAPEAVASVLDRP